MLDGGYGDIRTTERRIKGMQDWLANPLLMRADSTAEYGHTLEIDISEIHEPILCAPNDPQNTRLLSSVQGSKINEVFIGSCMTNIDHFRGR